MTRHPTAEWLARQITEAFPWTSAPAYLVRDNDRACGHVFTSRVRAMGIRDRPISPGLPWQNGCAERLIGTLRRECLDQVVIFSEMHPRRILSAYAAYYNEARTHLALQKDTPLDRSIGIVIVVERPVQVSIDLPMPAAKRSTKGRSWGSLMTFNCAKLGDGRVRQREFGRHQ